MGKRAGVHWFHEITFFPNSDFAENVSNGCLKRSRFRLYSLQDDFLIIEEFFQGTHSGNAEMIATANASSRAEIDYC